MKRRSALSVQHSAIQPSKLTADSRLLKARRHAALVHHSFSEGGFTLIELLVVLAIIGALAALTLGVMKYAQAKARNSRAKAEIASIENALENFKNDNGYFPAGDGSADSSTNIYNALVVGPKGYVTFRANQLKIIGAITNIGDPFGNTYYYRSPGLSNVVTFDLWSAGSDDKTNTADDVTNWQQH